MNSFFAYFSRLKFIKRWGLMRNVWPENDAEHTLQTVAIAHGLAVIRKEIFHEPCNPEHCAMCLPEIYLRRLNILMRVFMKNMKK